MNDEIFNLNTQLEDLWGGEDEIEETWNLEQPSVLAAGQLSVKLPPAGRSTQINVSTEWKTTFQNFSAKLF